MKTRPNRFKTVDKITNQHEFNCDVVINELVFKYLKSVYPISRTKFDGKFKRSIIIDGNTYSVSQSKGKFIPKLIHDISKSFAINPIESKSIIFNYFKIKNH
jgi:hypothetical protein